MKGLASTSPASAKVNIAGRSAREHYGLNVNTRFIAGTHERGRRSVPTLRLIILMQTLMLIYSTRYFHGYKGYHMILHMNWFTKKVFPKNHPSFVLLLNDANHRETSTRKINLVA